MDTSWQPAIGLEIHAQLLTRSKLFSPDAAEFIEQENVHVHPVSLGMPGTLPVLNQTALEYSIRTGLALGCRINKKSIFARKNYFYPDLPKGYQISQYDQPLCEYGYVEFICHEKKHKVRIRRVHMEEDAGRFHHQANQSLVNFNRSGVPLVEIVSEPDIRSPAAAAQMVRMVRSILQYIGVCDGSLEEGSLRCDCNVSIKRGSDKNLGTRTELKNINSFKFIEKAIEYEIKRHISILSQNNRVIRETRLYDASKNKTFSLRSKEESSDYRYFPDPDLLPVILSDQWIQKQQYKIPELPLPKSERFQNQYNLSQKDAVLLVNNQKLADYFEILYSASHKSRLAVNWLINEVMAELNANKLNIMSCPIQPKDLGNLIKMIDQKVISGKIAKKVFIEMWNTRSSAEHIIQKRNLQRISDEVALSKIVQNVINMFPKQTMEYKKGKRKVFDFFIGQIMKQTRGQADPEKLNTVLRKKLDS